MILDVTGIASWAKLTEATRDMGSSKADGAMYDYPEATNLNVALDQADLIKVMEALPKIKVNPTEDGMMVKFARKWVNDRYPQDGGEPEIVDKDGQPWDKTKLIGDGSQVRVAVEVYPTKFGPAGRLLKVMVLDYVESDYEPAQKELPF